MKTIKRKKSFFVPAAGIFVAVFLIAFFFFYCGSEIKKLEKPLESYGQSAQQEESFLKKISGGAKEENAQQKEEIFKVSFSSKKPLQGDSLVVKIEGDSPSEKMRGEFGSKKFDFFTGKKPGGKFAIIGIDAKETPGNYALKIFSSNEEIFRENIQVLKRSFPVTELVVTEELEEKGYSPSSIQKNIIEKENILLAEILSCYSQEPYFKNSFGYPLDKIINVGAFGNIRKSGDIELQHLGVDLDADTGTPVYSINKGKVCLKEEMTNYGKILAIDHGLGIFSLYLHLSQFNVQKGEIVEKGEIIGLSGNTGYSIAPHLHFSVKINLSNIDPLAFIKTCQEEIIY